MGGAEALVICVVLLASRLMHGVEGMLETESEDKYNKNRCNLYQGRWVRDSSYPLYNPSHCNFIQDQFNCQKFGRPDIFYQGFRWKPTSCKLPRFNGRRFMRKMRGKRIMFVGDSLSLNQWQSLTCMLHTEVPSATYKQWRTGGISYFKFPAYNVSLIYSRDALLVDTVKESNRSVLKLDSISTHHGELWRRADTLVFNSWHWWLHTGRKQLWNVIQEGTTVYNDMDRLVAYEKAIVTWATWIENNIDFTKTKVFFQGVSPDHGNSTAWGNSVVKSCRGEEQPVSNLNNLRLAHPAETVAERVLRTISAPIQLLNITSLSQVRIDGHPSLYGRRDHRGDDCTHWCLPGVPDTWNELLYAEIIHNKY